ncbi:MAG: NUDIX hydrolase [Fervidicoccaceae archaeon]
MRTVFRGRRIEVLAGEAVLPNGKRVYREYVRHPGAVVVLPEDDEGRILLLEQYRVPVGEWILELPAGTLEPGEDPASAALRELEEEAGLRARRIDYMFSFYASPGISSEVLHAFIARQFEEGQQRLERGELVRRLVWVKPEDVVPMIRSRVIKDGKTIAVLLYYLSAVSPRQGRERRDAT